MDTFKHVSRPAVWIVMLTLAFTTGVSMVLADHRDPPQESLMFDGLDDYVQVEHHADHSIATTGQLTVAVWMQPATLDFLITEGNGYVHWLSKGGPDHYEWAFRMYSQDTTHRESPHRCNESEPDITTRQNRISFYVFNPEGGQGVGSYFQYAFTRCDRLPQPVKAGEWIHVVGIADGAQTHIYKDGILLDSDSYLNTIRPTVGAEPLRMGARDLRIGAKEQNPEKLTKSYFPGGLGEIRIWNRALSKSEVSELYHFNTVPKGLVAEWLFNERTGTTARDTIGGHHGTIFGAYRHSIAGTAVIHAGTGTITLDASASTGPYTYPRYAVVRSTQEFASGAIRFVGIEETNRLWFAGLNNGDGTYMHVRRDQPDNANLAFAVVSHHKLIDLKFFEPPLPSTTIDEITIRWSDSRVDVVVQVDSQTKYTHHVELSEPLAPMPIDVGAYTNTRLTIDGVFTSE